MLRSDVAGIDLPMIQLMVAAITDHTGQPDLWCRYLRLLLDGMRARPDNTPLPGIAGHGHLLEAIGEASARQAQARPERSRSGISAGALGEPRVRSGSCFELFLTDRGDCPTARRNPQGGGSQ